MEFYKCVSAREHGKYVSNVVKNLNIAVNIGEDNSGLLITRFQHFRSSSSFSTQTALKEVLLRLTPLIKKTLVLSPHQRSNLTGHLRIAHSEYYFLAAMAGTLANLSLKTDFVSGMHTNPEKV